MAVRVIVQTRRHSMLESLVNTVTGVILSFGSSQLFYIYGEWIAKHIWVGFEWHISTSSNVLVTLVLTALSITRSYLIRRGFNKL